MTWYHGVVFRDDEIVWTCDTGRMADDTRERTRVPRPGVGETSYHAIIFADDEIVWICEHKHRAVDDAKDCAKELQKDYDTPCTIRPFCTSPGCGCWRNT